MPMHSPPMPLQVELKLERGATHELKLNLPYPMRDHKVFLKLLLLDTEMHPPPSAVVGSGDKL